MIWQDLALGLAGMIGSVTAVIHATLLQRLMVVPIRNGINEGRLLRGSPTRLVGPLLHFSGFGWLAGGIALIVAAIWLGQEAKVALGLLVGSLFLYGAIGNIRATRGRHPGGILMALACALIALTIVFPV